MPPGEPTFEPVENANPVDFRHIGPDPAMYSKHTVSNHTSEREIVEHVHKVVPDGGRAVFLENFVVKAVCLQDKWLA